MDLVLKLFPSITYKKFVLQYEHFAFDFKTFIKRKLNGKIELHSNIIDF